MSKAKGIITAAVLLSLAGVALWLNYDSLTWTREEVEDVFEFPDDPQDALLVTSYEPCGDGASAKGGVLIREIFRQALLIAGRDELGLPTRDESLREPFPDSSPEQTRIPLLIRAEVLPGKDVTLGISRRLDGHSKEIWKEAFPIGGRREVDYTELIELAERLSRDAFVDVLKSVRFQGTTPGKETDAQIPSAVEKRLTEMTFTEQFAALRELSAEMRARGQSAPLLQGLVRAYANLSKLCQSHWYASSKVFKARALLYAQRLMHVAPESASSYLHRAYARSMSGFPGAALDDLKKADSMRVASGDDAESGRQPEWVPLLDMYCRYQTEDLLRAGDGDGPHTQLALLLATLTREHSRSSSLLLEAGDALLAKNPECYHVIDLICSQGELGTLHQMATMGFETLTDTLPDRLRGMRNLPGSVRALLPVSKSRSGGAGGLSLLDRLTGVSRLNSPEPRQEARRQKMPEIAQALVAAGSEDLDRVEPSWSILGRIIQETIFKQMQVRGYFMRHKWSVPMDAMDEFVDWALPLVEGHPYEALIASYAIDRNRDPQAYSAVFKNVTVTDSELNMRRLLTGAMWYAESNDNQPGRRGWRFSWEHADRIDRDLHLKIKAFNDTAKPRLARALLEISPYAPEAMATLINHDWSYAEPLVDKWLEMHPRDPRILSDLAWHYTETGEFEKANVHLRQRIDVSPDPWAFRTLAYNYFRVEDYKNWKKVLEMQLEAPDAGLQHARARDRMARFHMYRQEYEEARPYADAAAQTWASWAMQTAAQCYEGLGKWKQADLWWRRAAQRYENDAIDWYFWCKRTGRGDVQTAEKLTQVYVKEVTTSSKRIKQERAGVFYLLKGEPEKAMEMFRGVFEETGSAYAGLHLALAALGADKLEECLSVLEQILKRQEEARLDGRPPQGKARLAKVFQETLKDEAAPLDLQAVDRIVAGAEYGERSKLPYFVGRFLEIRGRKEEATRYMHDQTFESPETKWDHILARDYLHRHNTGDAWEAVRRARILMSKGEPKEALARIDAYLEWELPEVDLCAAQCYEGLGRWDQAESFVRKVSGNNKERRAQWYFWCKRTGRGDVDAALRLAREHADFVAANPTDTDLEGLGAFYKLAGQHREALKYFQRAFERTRNPYDGLHAALLAEELGNRERCHELLREIAEHGSEYEVAGKRSMRTMSLAAILAAGLSDDKGGDFDLEKAQRLVRKATGGEKLDLRYFVGQILSLHGRDDEARPYFERCARDEMFHRWNLVFACDALRSRGREVALAKPWTFP